MRLPHELNQKIVNFLLSIPNIDTIEQQKALICGAGLDIQLQSQIKYLVPPVHFAQELITICMNYGELEDGRLPLEAILVVTKNFIGRNKRGYCSLLLQDIFTLRNPSKYQYQTSEGRIANLVQIILEGHSLSDFDQVQRDALVSNTAELLNIPRDYIRILEVRS